MTGRAADRSLIIDRALPLAAEPRTGHNRWHPDIPPVLHVHPGELVRLDARDATDGQIAPGCGPEALAAMETGRMHPLTGPVHVAGAEPDDLLEIEIVEVVPQPRGFALQYHASGLLAHLSPGPFVAHFDIAGGIAVSPQLPGVRFRGAPFMGVMGVAPDPAALDTALAFEAQISDAPSPSSAGCVPDLPEVARRGLRTLPPRANGGNMDIPQLTAGAALLLPVAVEGALFSTGDGHFLQAEGECVTGLEVGATLWCRFHLHKKAARARRIRGPQFRFATPPKTRPSRFFAVTGHSLAEGRGEHAGDMRAAVTDALRNMVDHVMVTGGFEFQQAYLICSLAADLRISQAVNLPNITAVAILDLSIFD